MWNPKSLKCVNKHKQKEYLGAYASAWFHGVAQVTTEVTGLIFRLITACQLGQALSGEKKTSTFQETHTQW